MKFQPEMFPRGTIFETVPNYQRHSHDHQQTVFEVDYVRNNDIQSYLLVTTTVAKFLDGAPHTVMLNLDWVGRIIKRGAGPLIVDCGMNAEQAEWLWNTHREAQQEHSRFGCQGGGYSRTHYNFSFAEYLLRHLMAKHMVEGNWCLDADKVREALLQQSFVHRRTVLFDGPHGPWTDQIFSAPKKRVDAWFKANCNRFLVNLEKTKKENDRLDQERDERSLDLTMDLLDEAFTPDTDEALVKEEGSCYSEYDREEGFRRDDQAWADARELVPEVFGNLPDSQDPPVAEVRRVTRESYEAAQRPDQVREEMLGELEHPAIIDDDAFIDEEYSKPLIPKFVKNEE